MNNAKDAFCKTLTSTEREIFDLLMNGTPPHEIARLRGRHKRTIHNQVASIHRKAGTDSINKIRAKFRGSQGFDFSHRKLPSRQVEVLELVRTGATNADIARQLGISASTVMTHFRRAARRLSCKSRAHLVLGGEYNPASKTSLAST